MTKSKSNKKCFTFWFFIQTAFISVLLNSNAKMIKYSKETVSNEYLLQLTGLELPF